VILLRRYRCRACRAILVVGPAGLVRARWYGGGPIAAALARYGRGEASGAIRRSISRASVVGPSPHERWITLTRWIDAAQRGALFGVCSVAS
jgi:hypothetical protein